MNFVLRLATVAGETRAPAAAAAVLVAALLAPARPVAAQSFADVPPGYWAFSFVEALAASGVTSGCGGGNYCPDNAVTRAQMAVFLERGIRGGGYVPPPATGTVFDDVGASDFAAAFIEQLQRDGITGGCGSGNYCPGSNISRAQMAVFLLRAKHGAGYLPPPATGLFDDVPPGSFAAAWIERLAAEAITGGCGSGNYCPNAPVTRAQMAVFLVRALLDPPVLSSIELSADSLVLDRWADGTSVTARGLDQDGREIGAVTIGWSSADDTIAAVTDDGAVTSWRGGDVDLTVSADYESVSLTRSVAVTVAVQRNPACDVPATLPGQGPVAPPGLWEVRRVDTQVVPQEATGAVWIGRQITLDVDQDGDADLLSMTHTEELLGIGVPIYSANRVWLNDGAANFSDGTDAILGQNVIPWNAHRNIEYADLDADGFRDAVVFQQGYEEAPEGCGAGGCPGGPNLLLLPRPAGLADSAPSRLSPYDLDGFTHSGAVGDLDCDGDVDIIEMQWGNADADAPHHLQLNSGAATFAARDSSLPAEILPDNSVSASVLCDLDRDGDPDLVTRLPGESPPADLRISVNDGFGNFRMLDADVLPVTQLHDEISCADLDLDGYADIVPGFGILRNEGDMTFTDVTGTNLPPLSAALTNSNGLAIVDFNGDGWPEFVPENGEVIYWNTGGGVFVERLLPGICCGSHTTVADFDTDGSPDIYHHAASNLQHPNTLFLGREPPAPARVVFATSGLYTADLGGLAGADMICQQHADAAGLPGSFAAFLSDSTTHAINRVPHAEYRRTGDGARVVPSKLELTTAMLDNAIANDENGVPITTDEIVRTGTEHAANRRQDADVGFCSDWTRATDESPGSAASAIVSADSYWWIWQTDRPCSVPQRLYCFER